MKKEDFANFSNIIAALAEEFGGKTTERNTLIKFKALKKFTIEEISQAASFLLKNRKEKYPPVPTTREFIEAIKGDNIKYLKNKAEYQADLVINTDRDNTPDFDDRITAYLMKRRWPFASWRISLLEREIKWFRKEFVAAYMDLAEMNEERLIEIGYEVKSSRNNNKIEQEQQKNIKTFLRR